MTATEKEKWTRIRAKGHTRYILRSFLYLGIPMWAAQKYGPYLYDAILHKPHSPPFLIWSPTVDFIFDFVLWVFGFGYLMGESTWQAREKDFNKTIR